MLPGARRRRILASRNASGRTPPGRSVSGIPASSTWAPLHNGVFRTLWITALAGNAGAWIQPVGAQWLLVHGAHGAILVSLVPTAALQMFLPRLVLARGLSVCQMV